MKTCRKGHERDDSLANCPVCRKARYEARKDIENESNRQWIKNNKERYKATQSEYKKANQEQVKQWYEEWCDENPYHSIYRGMLRRCYVPSCDHFDKYGGRGITVCERWRDENNGYKNFEADMGERPSSKHTLDRINNNGNYEPDNCKWSTKKEQQRNRRTNVLVTIRGVTKCLIEWAEESGLCYKTLQKRINKGWPEYRLLKPADHRYRSTGSSKDGSMPKMYSTNPKPLA
jgi:hypothetical protein